MSTKTDVFPIHSFRELANSLPVTSERKGYFGVIDDPHRSSAQVHGLLLSCPRKGG